MIKFYKIGRWFRRLSPVRFIYNAWRFRKELSEFCTFDYHYNLSIFCRSLELTKEFLESDDTVSMGTKENAEQIEQFIQDIHRVEHSLEYAEAELGIEFPDDWLSADNPQIRMFIEKEKEIEHTSWNRAMDNLRDNLRSWWD